MRRHRPRKFLGTAAALLGSLTLSARCLCGDIVVVMGPSAGALSKDQIANIYLGRNSAFRPLDLPDANAIRDAFYKKATDREPSQVKAVWARITFTGQGQPPKVLPDAAAVKKTVAADSKAVGYIDRADVDASVKIVLPLE